SAPGGRAVIVSRAGAAGAREVTVSALARPALGAATRRALARSQLPAPARRAVARSSSPLQPLPQVASCRSFADAGAPRTLAAHGAEARAGSPRACRDRADRTPPRSGRGTLARR